MSKHNVSQETQDIIDFMVDAEPGLHDSPLGDLAFVAKNIGADLHREARAFEDAVAEMEREDNDEHQ